MQHPITSAVDSPVVTRLDSIPEDWVDRNGHMSAVYYNQAFRTPMRSLFDQLGYDADFRSRTGHGVFMLDWRVQYVREVLHGDTVVFEARLLELSDKVLHYYMEMFASESRYLAAACEAVEITVDLETRRPVPFDPEMRRRLESTLAEHRKLPPPQRADRPFGIRR